MIEKPDVPDEVMLRALDEFYGISGARLEFVPRGLDPAAWAYRVEVADDAYFLKVSRRTEETTGAWMPLFLSRQGLEHVIPTLPTRSGEAHAVLEGLMYRLQPFVQGEPALDRGMPLEQWEEFGAFLGRLHCLEPSADVAGRLPRERFESRRWNRVSELQATVRHRSSTDPMAAEMFAFWRAQTGSIAAILERTAALAAMARQADHPKVLCHGDVHTNNILLGEDGRVYVIDWDDARLAPKERDLMFVLADAGEAQRASFFAGYRDSAVDPLILAYYQHEWCVEDIGAFAEEILDLEEAGTRVRANALSWFKTLFAPGNSVSTALATDLAAWTHQRAGAAPIG